MDRLTKPGYKFDLLNVMQGLTRYAEIDEILTRLAAYEDTGLEPHQIEQLKGEVFGLRLDKQAFEQLQQAGLLVVLPCKIGDTVYTIQEDYFECDECQYGAEAKHNNGINRVSCEFPGGRHCPYRIEEHVVEGFEIGLYTGEQPTISAPGKWGYEGLETFSGVDNRWHLTHAEAESALKSSNATQNI